jgi:hypothetical protein
LHSRFPGNDKMAFPWKHVLCLGSLGCRGSLGCLKPLELQFLKKISSFDNDILMWLRPLVLLTFQIEQIT